MRIRVGPELRREIGEHGAAAYPHECCGALLGSAGPEKTVVRLLRIDNARERAHARNRFLVTDDDYRRAERAADAAGLDLLGFYHSHPDHPARPSRYDLDQALPYFSYVIVAIERGEPGPMTSWVLAEDRSRFEEERITGAESPAGGARQWR
jgi:proteasome lid subunit RPN8/RPN11